MHTGSADPLSLQGVIPPTITVFDDEEEVDYERTADHARYVVDGGAHGVFPLGTNGEFPLLTGEERKGVVEAVTEEIDEVPVIAGVGAPSTYETVEAAEHAESVGADGLVVVTPYYYPLDGEAALNHYRRVADAVDLPVYIYHIPSKTGNALSLETLDGLAEIENLAGVKDSSKDVPWLAQAIDAHPELTFLAGSDSLLFPGLEIGCSGMVSAVANVFPELVVDLFESYDAGEEERARELQSDVYDVRDAIKYGSYMAGVKSALPHVGFEAGPLRSPLRTMDAESEEAMVSDLESLDLL
ncbi:4-hydroxy-tetrahydrodipicolinate synthase [Halalkalicoccus paucihalophilus]|uniref:4-hydroxy-tetrahydrodipicolinate synthase n=1 Tax=Halalkalicoccus paucihalophilus TaxID=1008153 RepID=A0A151AJ95_9EURY|nr:dihydrodipicolinate synthase family protein [Halalkalicoccus paucihalophilus]KYH27684.1 4-hydroxy-tetrahydrodipicolinate synthase [Halalkalicoccus paucihalophilus]